MSNPIRTIEIGPLKIANNLPFVLIAGPCQIEGLEHSLEIAGTLAEFAKEAGTGFIFKSSFDKANRSSLDGIRGPGSSAGLEILAEVRKQIGCPVLTDVHDASQCTEAASQVDAIQIPAFLCRQTDLLLAAGASGAAVNVKKGQFLAPWDVSNILEKIRSAGNDRVILCERGSCFGYNALVNDMRGLPIMASTGFPVAIDATHSVQEPGGRGGSSGGRREFAQVIARAAVAIGVAVVFIEAHENPDNAPSDGPNMIQINEIRELLGVLTELDGIAKAKPVLL